MKHFGDITKLSGYDLPIVDIVTGGSPCQDLSVAGKRAGLAGERSGLFMEQIRIIKEMREHDRESRRSDGRADEYIRPRYMVWENVPGAFSSNGGKDFHAVLEETAKVAERDTCIPGFEGKWPSTGCIMGNGWSIAWRVHDAQFWGVPQRRKRIALVADFGGETAPEILFERKGLSGDIAQGGKEGEGTSGNAERCAGETGINVCYGISPYDSNGMKSDNPHAGIYKAETARTLDPNGGNPACNQGVIAVVSVENHPADSRVKICDDGKVQALTSRMGTDGRNVPMVMEQPTCLTQSAMAMQAIGEYKQSEAASSLKMRDYKDATDLVVSYGLDRAAYNQGENAKYNFSVDQEKVGTCVAKGPNAVASFYPQMKAESQCWREDDVSNTLVNGTNPGFQNGICTPVVRRLTPLECERLQGYPVVRKVRFTEMTKDEYIAWNINEGNIVVDTEHGKVFATRGPGGVKLDEPKELNGSIVNGYRVVSIRNGETKMLCRVHRIVWIAEHGIIPDGYVIDHINNDKQDNRLCNLQLLTAAENSTKARTDGLYKIHGDSGSAKITDEVHDFIQYVYGNSDLSIRQLSEIFGISKSRVQQIIHDEPWTDIGDWYDSKGKLHKGDSDSPRYKALGNSIALPFWSWMAGRMVRNLRPGCTMASLFDGIGGFPFVFLGWGCEPVWASEIEEFPIAVTKLRFPEDDHNE